MLLLKEMGWGTPILQRVALEVSLLLVLARDILSRRRLRSEGCWDSTGPGGRTIRKYLQVPCVAPSHGCESRCPAARRLEALPLIVALFCDESASGREAEKQLTLVNPQEMPD